MDNLFSCILCFNRMHLNILTLIYTVLIKEYIEPSDRNH